MKTDDPIKKAQEVMKLIPHRYPFLLLDRILSYDSDSLVAIKSVSINEPFFQGHFPDRPIMPGVLIVEAMAQASGILGFKTMNKKPEDGSIYYFVGADNLRFKSPAVPGDQLILSSQVITNKKGIWKFDCKATVEEELVSEAVILCADRPK